jgi:hypothetical protein
VSVMHGSFDFDFDATTAAAAVTGRVPMPEV